MGIKAFKLVKRILPSSLYKRFLLIILIPNIIVQLFAVYMFYERHWWKVSKHMSVALAGDVVMLVKSTNALDDKYIDKFIKIAHESMYLNAKFVKGEQLEPRKSSQQLHNEMFLHELKNKLPYEHNVYYYDDRSNIAIDVQIPAGLLKVYVSKKRLASPSSYIFIMWMTGTALLFIFISVLFMRNQVRSISRLANVANEFGSGSKVEGFKPTGAIEVRNAAKAFIDMGDRLNRQMEQRTEMLAGVSHDLRTPLTRIKLQLAMMQPCKDIKELQDDIVEMEKMIQGYLDFAKCNDKAVDSEVNISDLMRSVVAGYRNFHRNIDLKTKSGILLYVNANSIRRAVNNIINNALHYGENVAVSLNFTRKNAIITVDDDGPGIPLKKRDQVFKPFYRIDSSRHAESGSTGLGLAIARDIIVGYGGDVCLENSPMGGLRVIIRLPLQLDAKRF